MTDQDPAAARLEYLARVLATPPASAYPCAADCGQPLTCWNTDAEGRRWHPDCLPPGTPMPITRSDREWQTLLDKATAELDLATEFRIPCPHPHFAGGHQDPRFRSEPITVRQRQDGRGDGWLILNPNLLQGDHVWTGSEWVYRGELYRDVIYKWTRDEALALAPELAAAETARYETWIAEMRAARTTPDNPPTSANTVDNQEQQ